MPDKKHNFTKTEMLAGALVLSSLAVLAGFIALIGGMRPETETRRYYARFTNTIGLDTGADVRFGGVKAGRVTEITPDPGDRSAIRVTLDVLPETPVNAESVATVEQISLTSPKHLDISTGKPDAPLLAADSTMKSLTKTGGLVEMPDLSGVLDSGEDLIADIRDMLGVQEARKKAQSEGEPGELPAIMSLAGDIRDMLGVTEAKAQARARGEALASAARIAEDVRTLLGVTETQQAVQEEGREFPSAAAVADNINAMLKEIRPKVDGAVGRLETIETEVTQLLQQLNGTLGENRGAITDILGDVTELTELIKGELQGLVDTLQGALKNTESLTGEAADLLETNRADIDRLISDLSNMVRNLDDFTGTLRQHPDAILKGKKQEGRRASE